MGKLVIDGNKVYTVDETCMKKKNLTLAQIQHKETGESEKQMKTRNRLGRSSYLQRWRYDNITAEVSGPRAFFKHALARWLFMAGYGAGFSLAIEW